MNRRIHLGKLIYTILNYQTYFYFTSLTFVVLSLSDTAAEQPQCRRILQSFGVDDPSPADCSFLHSVCVQVIHRSAILAALIAAGILDRLKQPLVGIAVEGNNYVQGVPYLPEVHDGVSSQAVPGIFGHKYLGFLFCSLFSLTWSAGCSQGITNLLHVWRTGKKDVAWHSVTIQGSETEDSKGQTHFYNGGGILYTNIWEQMGVEIYPPISWRS